MEYVEPNSKSHFGILLKTRLPEFNYSGCAYHALYLGLQ